eukprot:865104_1
MMHRIFVRIIWLAVIMLCFLDAFVLCAQAMVTARKRQLNACAEQEIPRQQKRRRLDGDGDEELMRAEDSNHNISTYASTAYGDTESEELMSAEDNNRNRSPYSSEAHDDALPEHPRTAQRLEKYPTSVALYVSNMTPKMDYTIQHRDIRNVPKESHKVTTNGIGDVWDYFEVSTHENANFWIKEGGKSSVNSYSYIGGVSKFDSIFSDECFRTVVNRIVREKLKIKEEAKKNASASPSIYSSTPKSTSQYSSTPEFSTSTNSSVKVETQESTVHKSDSESMFWE